MGQSRNRWIFYGRSCIQGVSEMFGRRYIAYRQKVRATAGSILFILRQLSPGNLLRSLILKDLAHF